MRHSESITKIAPALVAALTEIQNATKDAKNPHFNSNYASLKSVIDTAKPVLASHGIVVVQGPGWDGEVCTLDTMFLHDSGEWIASIAGAPVAKRDPQGVGSAITYLRRYGLAAMTGITQEDDDGNGASETRNQGTGQPHTPPAQKAPPKPGDHTCPKCGGGVYDNRTTKKGKQPDWKCKDKDACDWAMWVDSEKRAIDEALQGLLLAEKITGEAAQHTLAGVQGGDLGAIELATAWIGKKESE